MSNPIVTPDDLGTYLGVATIDVPRATLILRLAQSRCEAVVNPLPPGADAIILDVATRAWSNPTNAQSEATGPYSASFGAVGGGLWLTQDNKAALRRLAGGGGAFAIDMLPATAGQNLPWWDGGPVGDGFDVIGARPPALPSDFAPNLRAANSDFTAAPGDEVWVSVPDGVTVTGTLLPEPAGSHARIKRIDQSTGQLLIVTTDGALIDGQSSFPMSSLDAYEFDSDGYSFAVF